eukprot:GHVU01101465.1.p1 GENE.GHVU01101465.1~~GHVU01101465.1.p1  ORF type:complete len:667 (-),score=68.00 GHVU01101465.1:1938-3938(-)
MKGSSVSKYYRFLGKTSEWVWMQTRATIIYNPSSQPQYVVCMNYIIGEDEGQRYLAIEQENSEGKASSVPGYSMEVITSSGEASPRYSSSGDESSHHSEDNSQESMDFPAHEQTSSADIYNAYQRDHPYSQVPGPSAYNGSMNSYTNGVNSPDSGLSSSPGGMDASEFGFVTLDSGIFSDDDISTTFLPAYRHNGALTSSQATNSVYVQPQQQQSGFNSLPQMLASTGNPFGGIEDDIDLREPAKKSQRTVSNGPTISTARPTPIELDNGTNSILANLLKKMQNQPKGTLVEDATKHGVYKCPIAKTTKIAKTPVSFTVNNLPQGLTFTGDAANSEVVLSLARNWMDQNAISQAKEHGLESVQPQQQKMVFMHSKHPASTVTYQQVPSALTSTVTSKNTFTRTLNNGISSVQGVTHVTKSPSLVGGGNGPREGPGTSRVNGPSTFPTRTNGPTTARINGPTTTTARINGPTTTTTRINGPTTSRVNGPMTQSRTNTPSNGNNSSLLEQFLTSKEQFNPNKGSDEAFTAQKISELDINDFHYKQPNQNILASMLVGDMKPQDVQLMQRDIIESRHPSTSVSPDPTHPMGCGGFSFDLNGPGDITADTLDLDNLDRLDLLGVSTSVPEEMDFGPLDPSVMDMMHSDLDEVLQENARYGDSWLEYFGIT